MSIENDYKHLRDQTLFSLISEIEIAKQSGEFPPELEERAKLAKKEWLQRTRPNDLKWKILDDILNKLPENSTLDILHKVMISALNQMKYL